VALISIFLILNHCLAKVEVTRSACILEESASAVW
jgi:hypothetical protein